MRKIVYILGSAVIGMITLLSSLFVMMGSGVIDTERTKLVYRSESAEAVYSGAPLTCDEWTLVEGSLM